MRKSISIGSAFLGVTILVGSVTPQDLPQAPLPGDLDGDARVTVADFALLSEAVVSHTTPTCPLAADVSGNGEVQLGDLGLLIEHLIRKLPFPERSESALPCGTLEDVPARPIGGAYSVSLARPSRGDGLVHLRVHLQSERPTRGGKLVLDLPPEWSSDSIAISAQPSLELSLSLAEDGIVAAHVTPDGTLRCVWLVSRSGQGVALMPSESPAHLLDITLCAGSTPAGDYTLEESAEEPGELLGEAGELLEADVELTDAIEVSGTPVVCEEPPPTDANVRPYVWISDAEAEVGGSFRVSLYTLCNIETLNMTFLFDWDPDVFEVIGAEDVRGEGRWFNTGKLKNYDGYVPGGPDHVWQFLTPDPGPVGGIRVCNPCNFQRFCDPRRDACGVPQGNVTVRNYLEASEEPRSPLPADLELLHIHLIFRVLAGAPEGEGRIRLFEDPFTHTQSGADNSAEPFIPTGFNEISFFARPLVDAVITIHPSSGSMSFLRGDANLDGELAMSDPVATLMNLFSTSLPLDCLDAADANDDGGLDVSDAVYTLSFLFLGGPAPPAPYPEPGEDLTPDALGCGDGGA